MEKTFYRVSNEKTQQGLWYNMSGDFTGLIHDKFNFCKNNELKMDYDPELLGYLSATPDLESLYAWFTKNDILTGTISMNLRRWILSFTKSSNIM